MGRSAIVEPTPVPLPDTELLARLFRGLGDATRLQIIELLLERPRIQRDIVEQVGVSQGQVSQHLACLTWCGFVEAERRGRTVEYRVANPRVVALLDIARALLDTNEGGIAECRIIDRHLE